MTAPKPHGLAVVYCQEALNTPAGGVAHVLLHRSERYRVLSVVDRQFAGRDACEVVDGQDSGIPILGDVDQAVASGTTAGITPTHLTIGVAYEPGCLPGEARAEVIRALELGLHVVSGLHDLLGDDPELSRLARERGVTITDLRRQAACTESATMRGRLAEVEARRFAVLGTDVGVGKLTTCWALADALRSQGRAAEIVGTSVGAWLSGVRYTALVDSLPHRQAPAEIEHAVWSAWRASQPQVIVVQGWGSLLSPACPGGLEVIAAARPDCLVLQHAPARRYYQGADGFAINSLQRQIDAVEQIAGRRVVAVALSGEGVSSESAARVRARVEEETGLPAADPLRDGVDDIVEALLPYVRD